MRIGEEGALVPSARTICPYLKVAHGNIDTLPANGKPVEGGEK
jgi:hypothetical protein